MTTFAEFTGQGLDLLSSLFIFVLGILILFVILLFISDISQTKDAIRRNYPVIGHFRYVFITLGEFFRQYFFAMDREEMPFNRAEREWVNKSSRGLDNTIAFGSTKMKKRLTHGKTNTAMKMIGRLHQLLLNCVLDHASFVHLWHPTTKRSNW